MLSEKSDAIWLRNFQLLQAKGDFSAAARACLDVLAKHPEDSLARTLADDLAGDKAQSEYAIAFAKQLAEIYPDLPWTHHVLAKAYLAAKNHIESIESSNRALALDPDFAAAYSRRGVALLRLRRHGEAMTDFTRAVALDPGFTEAWAGLARTFAKRQHYKLAIGAYRRALAIEPDYPFLKARLLQQMILSCEWTEIDPLIDDIEKDIAAGKRSARPFVWQALSNSPQSLKLCAELYNEANTRTVVQCPARQQTNVNRKIRIGYVSGELREHSTSYLRVGVFENHDKDAFEIVAFDNGWDDGGKTRARINQAIDRIIDISAMSDADVALLIEQEEIDILIDLNGFNGRNRNGVFALRPAPIQVTFPGYPGTLGAAYIDYIIADKTIIPPEHMRFYAEQAVHMPDSYQANDQNRPISNRLFSRSELGLPDSGFVFCCFNNNYKIMPTMFDSWVRIMKAVPGSVLWLLADNPAAVANLREEASRRGLEPDRLIFAERMEVSEHLARHRAADLFLDTLPCNAHATASDALWSGLPMLTCLGKAFSGRVAASLLRATNLPELVTETMEDYERKAIHLASHPDEMRGLKKRLVDNRMTVPLFDTPRFTKHLERAYGEMFRRYHSGKPATPITVEA